MDRTTYTSPRLIAHPSNPARLLCLRARGHLTRRCSGQGRAALRSHSTSSPAALQLNAAVSPKMKRLFGASVWVVSALPAVALVAMIALAGLVRHSIGRWPTYGTYNPLPPDPIAFWSQLTALVCRLTLVSLVIWPFLQLGVARWAGLECVRRHAAAYLGSFAALVAFNVFNPWGCPEWFWD